MRGWTRGEEAATATTSPADITGLGGGQYLVSFEITNLSTTTALVLTWGAAGEDTIIKASPNGDVTWHEPIPVNGRLAIVNANNEPQVSTASGTAAYVCRWYEHGG